MELAKKYRWAKIGFIIMLLLNVVTLTTIWAIRPPFRQRPERRDRVENFLENELNLSLQQSRQFRELRKRHLLEMRTIMNEVHSLRGQYFDLIQNEEGTSRRDSIVTEISRKQAHLARAMYSNLDSLRALLNSGQKEKFDRIVQQSLRRPRQRPPNNLLN
ncbi:MAG: hypothetical protein PVH63_10885 [Balneolaceae bacterium]|jgi:hypothetical protein